MDAAARPAGPTPRGARRRLLGAGDDRLVARMRAGDEAAFEILYDRHHRDLLAFCRHMLGSREEAEDALQLVFLSMHRGLRDDDRPVRLKAWLYAVARNRCLSVLRARRDEVELDNAREPSTDGLAVADEVERRQDLRDLLADLARLREEQRAALLLSELGDLTHEEIAVVLEVRRDKVKAIVFQAREALMTARRAREADCRGIQEQLASLRGGALRRATLARHVAMCPACAAFKAELARQRAALALVLPVVPSVVVKQGVLAGLLAGGGGGTAAVTGGAAAGGGGVGPLGAGFATKVLMSAVLAGGATTGGVVALHQMQHRDAPDAPDAPDAADATSARTRDAAAVEALGRFRRGVAAPSVAAPLSRAKAALGGRGAGPGVARRSSAPGRAVGHGGGAGARGRAVGHGGGAGARGRAVGHGGGAGVPGRAVGHRAAGSSSSAPRPSAAGASPRGAGAGSVSPDRGASGTAGRDGASSSGRGVASAGRSGSASTDGAPASGRAPTSRAGTAPHGASGHGGQGH